MIYEFVDEGRGPEMPEVISEDMQADRGRTPLYFYRIDEIQWLISDEPITQEVYEKWCKENYSFEDGLPDVNQIWKQIKAKLDPDKMREALSKILYSRETPLKYGIDEYYNIEQENPDTFYGVHLRSLDLTDDQYNSICDDLDELFLGYLQEVWGY